MTAGTGLARLVRSGWHRRSSAISGEILCGSLDEIARHLAAEDPENLWQFIIVTPEEHYIRGAELRALVRGVQRARN